MGLLFLRSVILRVLREVAMRARLGDVLDDARTLHRLALLQFDLERGVTDRGHRSLFHHLFRPSLVRAKGGTHETLVVSASRARWARKSSNFFGPGWGPIQLPRKRWVPASWPCCRSSSGRFGPAGDQFSEK